MSLSRIENEPIEVPSSQVRSDTKHNEPDALELDLTWCRWSLLLHGSVTVRVPGRVTDLWVQDLCSWCPKPGPRNLLPGDCQHCSNIKQWKRWLRVGGVNCNQLTFSRKKVSTWPKYKRIVEYFIKSSSFFFFELSQSATYLVVNSCCQDDWNTVSQLFQTGELKLHFLFTTVQNIRIHLIII